MGILIDCFWLFRTITKDKVQFVSTVEWTFIVAKERCETHWEWLCAFQFRRDRAVVPAISGAKLTGAEGPEARMGRRLSPARGNARGFTLIQLHLETS